MWLIARFGVKSLRLAYENHTHPPRDVKKNVREVSHAIRAR
jgi:hypothetical protein